MIKLKAFVAAILPATFLCTLNSTPSLGLPFKGSHMVMSAANRYAVLAGQKIAERGGNAIDCAVTMVLVMSVTNPTFGALGGGGFAVVHMGNGKDDVETIDFRERAPAATSPTYYLNKPKGASITGGAAVGVPGLVAGLWAMHSKYGHLKWAALFDEAINLAETGYRMSGELSEDTEENLTRFNSKARSVYVVASTGKAVAPGELVIQKDLARALKLVRDHGVDGFYGGKVAEDVVASVKATGGDMTLQDLKDYKVAWRAPLKTSYHGYNLFLMPPPSSGGILVIRALKMLDLVGINKTPILSVDEYHLLIEVLKRAFRDRGDIGDPDHYAVPVDDLINEASLKTLAKSISRARASTTAEVRAAALMPGASAAKKSVPAGADKPQTTHLSVLDSEGHGVAMTYTLNGEFGSAVATDTYGIFLNNEMDDFTTRPGEPNMFGLVQGAGNQVEPGKRPLSSMTPTLVEKDGKFIMAVGAPGGPRITSAVIQTLYRVLGRGMSLERAVEAPRVHHQFLPDKVFIDEDGRMPYEMSMGLKARHHVLEPSWGARIYSVKNNDGILEGVVDSRGEGASAGF